MNADRPDPSGMNTDRLALRALLRAYFRMSFRGKAAQAVGRGWRGSGGSSNRGILFLIGMDLFIGLFLGLTALAHPDLFTYSILLHAITLFAVGLSVMSESGDILFNASESEILGSAPVRPQTILLAKTLNLFGFSLLLALALNLFGIFLGLAAAGARPWFPLVHLASTILMSAFCAAGIVFIDALVVRFVDRERFDSAIVWVQVALTVLMMVGYQFIPRLMRRMQGLHLESNVSRLFFLPPAWFAGLDAALAGSGPRRDSLVLAGIGVLVTLLLAYLAIRRLSAGFVVGMSRMAEAAPTPPAKSGADHAGAAAIPSLRSWRNPILRLWVRDPVERSAFDLAAAALRRDRDVRLRVYPTLAAFLILPLMGLVDKPGERVSFVPYMALWLVALLPVMTTESLRMSSNPAAAEVFRAAPLKSPAPIFHGVRKAVLVMPGLPITIICVALTVAVASDRWMALRIAIPILIASPTFSLGSGIFRPYLPFSKPVTRGSQGARSMGLWWIWSILSGAMLLVTWQSLRSGIYWYFLGALVLVVVPTHRALTRRMRAMEMPAESEA
jgi:ABC-2 type transport system permease protein